jgi:hypothetical protein
MHTSDSGIMCCYALDRAAHTLLLARAVDG